MSCVDTSGFCGTRHLLKGRGFVLNQVTAEERSLSLGERELCCTLCFLRARWRGLFDLDATLTATLMQVL